MRVLMIITARQVGGAEIYAARLVRDLAQECQFTVALADAPAMSGLTGEFERCARVVRFPFDDTRHSISVLRALRRLCEQHDLIHINSNHPASRWGVFLAAALARGRPPVVCVEQRVTPVSDIRVPRAIGWVMPLLFRWSRRGVARVIAVSQQNARMLIEYYGLAASQVQVIHNGADLAVFQAQPPDGQTLRSELGLTGEQRIVLVLGRLAPNKGQQFLVRAAPAILDHFPSAHFVFAGGLEGRAFIDREIAELGLSARISLLGFREDSVNLLNSSDVLVHPSLGEGFSLSIVEAMAAGLPVVSTDVGGASEIIRDGENGWLVPAGDVSALASGVIRALDLDAGARARLKQAAMETARRFPSQETARQTLQVYREAVSNSYAHRH